jgi:hypothetical protein
VAEDASSEDGAGRASVAFDRAIDAD